MNKQEEFEGLDEEQRRARRLRRDTAFYVHGVNVGCTSAEVRTLGPNGWGLEADSWEAIRKMGFRYLAGAFLARRLAYEEWRRRMIEGAARPPFDRHPFMEMSFFFYRLEVDVPMTTAYAMSEAERCREHCKLIGEWPYWWEEKELENLVSSWREDAKRLVRAGISQEKARRLGADENVIGMMEELER